MFNLYTIKLINKYGFFWIIRQLIKEKRTKVEVNIFTSYPSMSPYLSITMACCPKLSGYSVMIRLIS